MGQLVRLKWPTLDTQVTFELEDRNPELSAEFWSGLDFECLQDHGSVSGQMVYCWTPLVSLAKVNFQDLHTNAPPGRVHYSQGTGNKLIVTYGKITEDIAAPVLGHVLPKDVDKLPAVGAACWQSTYLTKVLIPVLVSRVVK